MPGDSIAAITSPAKHREKNDLEWRSHLDRRNFVAGSAAMAAALGIRRGFAEDAYPSHTITIIDPFPPGGASDAATRPLAALLEPIVKQPVVIETVTGAAGATGAETAAISKPDGYTLLSHTTSISAFAEVDRLFGRPVKFTRADFVPIARFAADPCVLIVNERQPYKTLKDLTADAKKRPDEIAFSSSGLYGALHIPMALYMKAAGGLKLRHMPADGGGPALTAFLGNSAQVLVMSVSACLAQIKAGKAKPLALYGANRSKALPDVPTMKELGYNIEYYLWAGMFAPKGTPRPIVTILRGALKQAAATEMFKTAMANLGQQVEYLDAPEFAKFWDADAARVEDAVKEIGRVQS
jgi:tripartite-type tricarboxylate transporter receptor subunit TctC